MKVISPINYYFIQGGKIERPSSFIGDIALKYSLMHQLGIGNFFEVSSFKPNYEELSSYNFWFTVGVPISFDNGDFSQTPLFMKPMIRNTMQGIDVTGSNVHPNIKAGSIMYKNFYMQEFIKPGNLFITYFIDYGQIEIPKTLRVGTGKVGVLELEEIPYDKLNAFINLYTVKNILKKEELFKKLSMHEFAYTEHIALPYYIVGPISDYNIIEELYE
ncbi:MAG: type I-D CRISPR-associated protein Cas5/Csc1 [Thermoplasmata archaeon]